MKYEIDKNEKYTVVTLNEEKLDTTIASDMKSEFVTLNAEGHGNLILDLEKVKYVDSSGLSSILVANRLCNDVDGTFVLCNVSDHVMKLIKISQLDSILNIMPSRAEATDNIMFTQIENDLSKEGSDE